MSAAALAARPPSSASQRPRHCPEKVYLDFVASAQGHLNRQYLNAKRRYYRAFRRQWPNLAEWFVAPLTERVGRLPGEQFRRPSYPVSFLARPYLMFLGLRGYTTFDYPWMLAIDQLRVTDQAVFLGLDFGTEQLVQEAVALGYHAGSARQAMSWSVHRILLRHGLTHVTSINEAHVLEALEAVRQFIDHPAFAVFYPSAEHYRDGAAKTWITHLHQLQVVLFHRGQVSTQPRKLMPPWKPAPALPPRMQAVADKWLAARRLTDRPATVNKLELATRRFGEWLSRHHPDVDSLAQVTREHCLDWIQSLADEPTTTGKPLGVISRIQRISGLSQLFRDTAAWQWDDVPGHTLIGAGDAPKQPLRVPRFIPDDELDRLMPVIDELSCPFQRAALLVARWSGARRDEIRRLAVDCLDSYPDGTARLRLPARKTYRERVVPLHDDAAAALRTVIELRRDRPARAFADELTGAAVRYLFMRHGKLLSTYYLFDTPIQRACKKAGLVHPDTGRGAVTAHRFRHTVGTQLAERGAKLHTIMKVLGHSSVSMALVYAQISDREVLRDYQAVLAPGPPSPAPPPTRSNPASCQPRRWTGSRPTSSRPSWSSATACAYPPKGPANATST